MKPLRATIMISIDIHYSYTTLTLGSVIRKFCM